MLNAQKVVTETESLPPAPRSGDQSDGERESLGRHVCKGLSVPRGDAQKPRVCAVHTERDPACLVVKISDCVAGHGGRRCPHGRFRILRVRGTWWIPLGSRVVQGQGKGHVCVSGWNSLPPPARTSSGQWDLGNLLVLLMFQSDFMVDLSDIFTK